MIVGLAVLVLVYLLIAFPSFRCAVFHPFSLVYNAVADTYMYIKHHKADECGTGEIVAFVGLFGKGKTLSLVHKICGMYRRYNDRSVWCPRRQKFVTQKIKVLSNVELAIPYEKLVSLEQIVLSAEKNRDKDDAENTLTVTLVLGDEFSVQLNSRNFKSNINPLFLNTLLTCRHYHISLYYSAQRFGHVDALLRQVTSYVVSCDKLWRFQRLNVYDAWEMENASDPTAIAPRSRACWFVRDSDYAAYDTLATVGNLKKSIDDGDMMTDAEILALQCNQPADAAQVQHPSKHWIRLQRKIHK